MDYLSVTLEKSFARCDFDCQNSSLNDYIKKQVSQDVKKKLSVCFVLLADDNKTVARFYTLSNGSIYYENV
jgi:hypothetical protein